jgi:DNA replication and repair protein RecF
MIKKIKLLNFRNYQNIEVCFSPGINIIYGDNAQGKTNLLESIYFLAITKSHRSFIDKTIINNTSQETVVIGEMYDQTKYKVYINNKEKRMYINDYQIKKLEEYISNLNVVIFCPDDIEIIKGSPQERRKMANIAIGQKDKKYLFVLGEYNLLLKTEKRLFKKTK